MDAYDGLVILLGTLGYRLFEHIRMPRKEDLFFCARRGSDAKGMLVDDGFMVFAESVISSDIAPSAMEQVAKRRQKLLSAGVLHQDGGAVAFAKDHTFRTPSGAAFVISGAPSNGWVEWRTREGKTLDEVKRKTV